MGLGLQLRLPHGSYALHLNGEIIFSLGMSSLDCVLAPNQKSSLRTGFVCPLWSLYVPGGPKKNGTPVLILR